MPTNFASTWDELINTSAQNAKNYDPNEKINLQDARLTNVESARENEIKSTTDQYNQMINNADQFYDRQAQVARENAERQSQVQNASTEQQIKEINQQREKTERDYQKEQRGAYTDYQKQVNEYGVNAEIMASRGLANTGYSESSQVSMYNAYQNRVATARQSLADSQQNYDNLIAQARINNDTRQAEIANELAKAQAEYALAGFQYKNSLIESRQQQLNVLNSRYDTKYNTMLSMLQNELDAKRENYQTNVNILLKAKDYQQQDKELDMKNAQFEKELAQKERQFQQELSWNKQKWQQEYNLEKQKLQNELETNRLVYSSGQNNNVVYADAKVAPITYTTSSGLLYQPAQDIEPIPGYSRDNVGVRAGSKVYKAI